MEQPILAARAGVENEDEGDPDSEAELGTASPGLAQAAERSRGVQWMAQAPVGSRRHESRRNACQLREDITEGGARPQPADHRAQKEGDAGSDPRSRRITPHIEECDSGLRHAPDPSKDEKHAIEEGDAPARRAEIGAQGRFGRTGIEAQAFRG